MRRADGSPLHVVVSIAMLTLYFREADSGPMHSVQGAVARRPPPFQVGAERRRAATSATPGAGWTAGLVHARSENEELRKDIQLLRLQVIQNPPQHVRTWTSPGPPLRQRAQLPADGSRPASHLTRRGEWEQSS